MKEFFHSKALIGDEVVDDEGGFECYEGGDLKEGLAG